MILQIKALHALCFLVVNCVHIHLGFMVYLERLLHIIWHFGYFDVSVSKKYIYIYYQYVRNAVLDFCAKSVPVWGKRGEMRGLLRGEIYLDMSFGFHLIMKVVPRNIQVLQAEQKPLLYLQFVKENKRNT